MFSRIMVLLDGSEVRERILPLVIALAEKFDASITLLVMVPPPETSVVPMAAGLGNYGAPIGSPYTMEQMAAAMEANQQEMSNYVRDSAVQLRRLGLAVRTVELETATGEAIAEHARDWSANLIDMTTRGRGGLERLVLGSIGDEVMRHAPCPILLLKVSEDEAER